MDSDQAKLFVGGISRETTEDNLKDHFSQFGEVLESVVAKDRSTGNSRGFGFVRFSEFSAADEALSATTHVILNRKVEVKKAVPRSGQPQNTQQHPNNGGVHEETSGSNTSGQFRTKKVFVGGLSSNLTKEEFRNYFEKFGSITDSVVMHDSVTNKPRGFGFVTFDSEESVENVIQKSFHELNNKRVEVKRAIPKESSAGNGTSGSRLGTRNGSDCVMPQYAQYPLNGMDYSMFYYPPAQVYGDAPGLSYPMGAYYRYTAVVHNPHVPWHDPMMNGYAYYIPVHSNLAMYSTYQNAGVNSLSMAAAGKLNQVVCENGQAMVNEISPRLDGLKLGDGDAPDSDRVIARN